ncbi:MAG: hypothetical protein KDE53_22020 [Caldilineaceae bacterium]|nr:hypothetical protein [Caldilineaceae bacterium]
MFFHITEPYTCTTVDERARQAWEQDGVVKITGLIPLEWFVYLRNRVIEALGTPPEHPEAWPNLKPLGRDKECMPLAIEAVKDVVDQLIGKGWAYPNSGGGWFTNAPRQLEKQHAPKLELVPRGHWHWDARPDLQVDGGLWLFAPVTEMLAHSGGTWLAAGSARMVTDFYANLPPEKQGKPTRVVKKWFADAHKWFNVLNGAEPLNQANQVDEAVRLLTVAGQPGDVILMKEFTIHSAPDYIGPGSRVCRIVTISPIP